MGLLSRPSQQDSTVVPLSNGTALKDQHVLEAFAAQ